jgi:hypothetical protein
MRMTAPYRAAGNARKNRLYKKVTGAVESIIATVSMAP